PPGLGRFRTRGRQALWAGVLRAVELQVRRRGFAAGALRLELRCAVVDPGRYRSSISPQLSKAPAMSNLHAFDLLFIAGYFIILFGIAWCAPLRDENVRRDHFLADRAGAGLA